MHLRRAMLSIASSAALLSACGEFSEDVQEDVSTEQGAVNQTEAAHRAQCQTDPRVTAGQVSLDVCVGASIFFRETFNGNGRTCATCHAVKNNYTIDPAFISTLPNTDKLFIAEQVPALANLERPAQMRARALILENVDGFGADPNVRFVLRSTPHNLSMGTSILTPTPGVGPAERTGWSADGAPSAGRLADFTNGAIGQHFTTNLDRRFSAARPATEQEGQLVATFMRELGRKNEIDLQAVGFGDATAEIGRQRFLAVGCNGCHRNAGANTGANPTVNRNFNTGVETARNTGLNAFPRDGGLGTTPVAANGAIGDGTFNSTPLIEAADTGPFFHTDTTISSAVSNNTGTANTIEEATAFYSSPAFANSPAGAGAPLAINATDVINIGRFLRSLNAIFNIQMALKRVEGTRNLGNVQGNASQATQIRLIDLAIEEINDALSVLQGAQGGALNANAVSQLNTGKATLTTARGTASAADRTALVGQVVNNLTNAKIDISANVDFNIGAGTLMDGTINTSSN